MNYFSSVKRAFRFETKLVLATLMIFAGAASTARADSSAGSRIDLTNPGVQAAIKSELQVVSDLGHGRLEALAQRALNHMVAEGIQALRDSGNLDLANQFETEWKSNPDLLLFSDSLMITPFDLGDHRPLSQWLANFYEQLSSKTMGVIKQIRLIRDINKLNYALPVVFNPKGKNWMTGGAGDYIEYRKHFIPFVNIITYWLSYQGCKYAMNMTPVPQLGSQICTRACEKLEWFVGRYVSYHVSDFIFKKANRIRMTSSSMISVTREQLEEALQMPLN